MNTQNNKEVLTKFVFVLVPLFCILVFFLPVESQDLLKARYDNLNPLTYITSVFVHSDLMHLVGNLAAYLIIGILVYVINRKTNRQKFFLYSVILIVFLLPLLYHAVFIVLNNLIFGLAFVSCGLSLIVGGLIGLIIPSVDTIFYQEPNLRVNSQVFFLSSVCLTGSVILFPYLDLKLQTIAVFALVTSVGGLLIARELLKILDFCWKHNKEERKNAVTVLLSLSLYFIFLSLLFPANIVQFSGNIVNIFAHFFGVFFGLFLGYFMMQVNRLGSTRISFTGRIRIKEGIKRVLLILIIAIPLSFLLVESTNYELLSDHADLYPLSISGALAAGSITFASIVHSLFLKEETKRIYIKRTFLKNCLLRLKEWRTERNSSKVFKAIYDETQKSWTKELVRTRPITTFTVFADFLPFFLFVTSILSHLLASMRFCEIWVFISLSTFYSGIAVFCWDIYVHAYNLRQVESVSIPREGSGELWVRKIGTTMYEKELRKLTHKVTNEKYLDVTVSF